MPQIACFARFACGIEKCDRPAQIRVDKEHPHHFVFDDGTHFFMQGYEYDWLWALDNGLTSDPVRCQRIASALAPAAQQATAPSTAGSRPGS